jgi:hypothetical protein
VGWEDLVVTFVWVLHLSIMGRVQSWVERLEKWAIYYTVCAFPTPQKGSSPVPRLTA